MEEACFKSVLPGQDPVDTSLALPAEERTECQRAFHSNDRSLRVRQQVQLTLSRRVKKTNGSVHVQKSMRSHEHRETSLPIMNMSLNESGFSHQSLSRVNVRRPVRRVEVSPIPSPKLPHSPSYHRTLRFGTYTIPGPRQAPQMGPLLDRTLGSSSFRSYAFSEVPRNTRLHATTYSARRSAKQMAWPQPVFTDARVEVGSPNGPFQGHQVQGHQVHTQGESDSVLTQSAFRTLGASQDAGLAWLAQVRKEDMGRQNSYALSVASIEVDAARRMEKELQVQEMKTTQKGESKAPELTLERAVNMLTQDNEDTVICAASFIQSQCFSSLDAKKMVFYLHGIPKLLHLLDSDSEDVQRLAAGALRNAVFQSDENKMEVKEKEGMAPVLRTLQSSRDIEARRQLTGLLWNLSSHDLLKEHISKKALSVLTNRVLIPCSGLSEGENPKDDLLGDPDVFHNATGCLRNLSSSGPDSRKAMRDCENLIDSLVYYIRGTIADYKPDDKSTENSVCILHNLSYEIEAELPHKHARELSESRQNLAPQAWSPGCFAYRSAKITEDLERHCPLLEEKANPHGVEWLWSAITVRMYLSLMARSVRHDTQEAALGALQNVTSGHGAMTEAICHTVVQRENGLQPIRKMLQEGDGKVKRTAVSLIKNLSRYSALHADIVAQVLPELVGMLPNSDQGAALPTEVTLSLCHVLTSLSQNQTQHVRAIVNHGALPKIINISTKDNGYGPSRAGQAACVLLHSMWRHSDLRGAYRKAGYRKADFINARTTKAVNSSRD